MIPSIVHKKMQCVSRSAYNDNARDEVSNTVLRFYKELQWRLTSKFEESRIMNGSMRRMFTCRILHHILTRIPCQSSDLRCINGAEMDAEWDRELWRRPGPVRSLRIATLRCAVYLGIAMFSRKWRNENRLPSKSLSTAKRFSSLMLFSKRIMERFQCDSVRTQCWRRHHRRSVVLAAGQGCVLTCLCT